MSKLIVMYTLSGLCLFGALFAAFAIVGIGRPVSVAPAAMATQDVTEPVDTTAQTVFLPPTLEAGRTYRISHDTPMYEKPDAATGASQTLPAGGYFTAVYTLTDVPGPWTQITVSDGFRDYPMYMQGPDLRWKVLTPIYSTEEEHNQKTEEAMRVLAAIGERRRAQAALEEEEPVEPEQLTFAEWWAERADQMGGATVANVVVAGAASAGVTFLIIGSVMLISMLRREQEWSRPTSPDDEVIDLHAEDEDPFTYSAGGSVHAAHDDEDPRRA
jgi:hypothetical protein